MQRSKIVTFIGPLPAIAGSLPLAGGGKLSFIITATLKKSLKEDNKRGLERFH